MPQRIEVGVLGATGMVGQQFVNQLRNHPWFELTWLGASERSAGKTYAEATNWVQDSTMPAEIAGRTVREAKPEPGAPKLMFSAMDASVAGEIEKAFARAGHVIVSNSKNHRMDPHTPLLVPEINPDHLGMLDAQRAAYGWEGAIVTNPNCSTVALVMGLAPLKPFGIRKVNAVTLQAISGAGYPGLPSIDIVANAIPYIGGEEDKVETEPLKILGSLRGGEIQPLEMTISAQCNRVQVIDGHMVCVSVELEEKAGVEALKAAFREYSGAPQQMNLPTAPAQPVVYLEEPNRPQPRRDALAGGGMTVSVGRLRECPLLDYKFVCLGHNTIRGAAGAAVLNAELMHAQGLLG
ncbi:MAG: aspartate-semialdehyde dehydrogenase [Acidobacteria bacterium]|nr:aspartate-semialdehyde dehydrogenase [Acidobacteriota bacterium]